MSHWEVRKCRVICILAMEAPPTEAPPSAWRRFQNPMAERRVEHQRLFLEISRPLPAHTHADPLRWCFGTDDPFGEVAPRRNSQVTGSLQTPVLLRF